MIKRFITTKRTITHGVNAQGKKVRRIKTHRTIRTVSTDAPSATA